MLPLLAASVNLVEATVTVGVPSLVAVHVAEYTVVEVAVSDPRLQPVAVMSPTTKLEVASLEVKLSTMASVLVEAPLDTVLEAIVIVGAVPSYVHV